MIVFGLVWNQWSFFSLITIIFVGSLIEFYNILQKRGFFPNKWLGVFIGLLVFFSNELIFPEHHLRWIFLIAGIPCVFIAELYRNKTAPTKNIAFTILGILYIAIPYSLLVDMSLMKNFTTQTTSSGFEGAKILCLFLLVWGNDTGAYFSGKYLGKRKLFERISPNKTWEGFFGGVITAILVGQFLCPYVTDGPCAPDWLILSLLIPVFATLGDLAESLIKRDLKIKDSGTIIPGHGGFLDRFDGLVFTIPVIYLYIQVNEILHFCSLF